MAWKDNALGIVVDNTMNVDFASLKQQGMSFAVIEIGTGFDQSPMMGEQINKANSAGLQVILQFTPFPAIDDYTFEGCPTEQLVSLKKWLSGKKFNGLVISADRWWVNKDIETKHIPVRMATATAISHTTNAIMQTLAHDLGPLSIPVMIRTNDNFVKNYSPELADWTDNFGFFLADWRYRTRDAEGAYSFYTSYKAVATPLASVDALKAVLPPEDAKNPLVPGNAPSLKFWEFSGSRFILPQVKDWKGNPRTAKFALFNGNVEAMKTWLGGNVVVTPPTPPTPPTPTTPPPTVPVPDPDVTIAMVRILQRLEAAINAFAKTWIDFK